MFYIKGTRIERTNLSPGKVVLTPGIPSRNEERCLFFLFIAGTKSKREFFKKPCGRTTQFSAGLHIHSESSAGQSSLGVFSVPESG
jgi:hypothetical protein